MTYMLKKRRARWALEGSEVLSSIPHRRKEKESQTYIKDCVRMMVTGKERHKAVLNPQILSNGRWNTDREGNYWLGNSICTLGRCVQWQGVGVGCHSQEKRHKETAAL